MKDASPLEFPCRFPIKVLGRTSPSLQAHVTTIVSQHVAKEDILTTRQRSSRDDNFLSITVTINARSREQLDSLYMELTASEQILMVF